MKLRNEQKAADALLSRPYSVLIANKLYHAKRPTIRTMIEASSDIARLPVEQFDKENILSAIAAAKDCQAIGDVFADFLLAGQYGWRYPIRKRRLARKIIERTTPGELVEALTVILQQAQVADFFALTTSLSAISLLRATKEVE